MKEYDITKIKGRVCKKVIYDEVNWPTTRMEDYNALCPKVNNKNFRVSIGSTTPEPEDN